MDVGWMHWPYFMWLVCEQKSGDCIGELYNGVRQLQVDYIEDVCKGVTYTTPSGSMT
jgi:hypothetical protein